LLLAFHETHEEANRLVVIGNKLKNANNFLELNVKSLEKELHEAQTKFVNLEMICLHASYNVQSSKMEKNCKNCKVMEDRIKYLLKNLSKFTMGRANLETDLGSQNYVFGKSGLGYKPGKKNNVKKLSSFFVPTKTKYVSFNNYKNIHFISCFYCMKNGHISRSCRLTNYLVTRGLAKWLPKER